MAEQTNPATGVEQGAGLSVEQRLANLYGAQMAPPDEPPAPEETPATEAAPEQAAQDESQADELTADDLPDDSDQSAQPTTDEFELVHNGTQIKLDRAKTIELAQKGFDYTSKTQALAAQQKQAQEILQRAQELEQLAPEIANEAAMVRAAEQALQPWQNVDWVRLATEEPLEYGRYRAQYDQLLNAYHATRGQFQQKATAVQQQKQALGRQIVQQEMEKLREFMPQMRDPARFAKEAATIKEYGLDRGYSDQELESVTDARMVRTLWEAAQYRNLVKSKAEKSKQLRAAPPTAKPGALGQTQSADAKRVQETRSRLKKSGDWRDAASLLSRMK